ncbi:MAG: hypothetical protein LBI33_03035, partial [Propionibacteriaceae bacterium]|nr:hypothetical protein [Propionibacteriaceae bacterium]
MGLRDFGAPSHRMTGRGLGTSRPTPAARHLAGVTAFVLLATGVVTAIAPVAEAAPTTGTFPITGWYTDPATGTTNATKPWALTQPMVPIDDGGLFGSANQAISTPAQTGGWVGSYTLDGTRPTGTNADVFANGNGSTRLYTGDGIGNGISTIALDANMRGDRDRGYMYFWGWNGDSDMSAANRRNLAAVVGVDALPTSYLQPVFRVAGGETVPEVSVIPTARYFESLGAASSWWSGGEVVQSTGEVFFSGGECTALGGYNGAAGGFRMMVWNPQTGAYNYSGPILPKTATDAIFGGGFDCNGNGTVASDMALDANGNAYILVQTNRAVPSMGYPSTLQRVWLVRVVPSTTGDWTYNLVTALTAAPDEPAGSEARTFAGTATTAANLYMTYGMAFFAGQLYASNYNTRTILAINPMSGQVRTVPPPGPVPVSNPQYIQDLASGQTAYVVEGAVYDDRDANGAISADEPGLGGVQVALYRLDPATGDY